MQYEQYHPFHRTHYPTLQTKEISSDHESTIQLQQKWAEDFLRNEFAAHIPKYDGKIVLIGHVRHEFTPFFNVLNEVADVACVLPKPKSIIPSAFDDLKDKTLIRALNRDEFSRSDGGGLDFLKEVAGSSELLLFDIGGYFSPIIYEISKELKVKAIIEDTTNGHERYEELSKLPLPTLSIARSFSKRGQEDWDVGRDVLASSVNILHEASLSLKDKNILIIGYGSIGEAIGLTLGTSSYGQSSVSVLDIDETRGQFARFAGNTTGTKEELLSNADVIFVAAPFGIKDEDLELLKNGAAIFSVTSADDSLSIEQAYENYTITSETERLELFQKDEKYFYLGNKGNATNFIYQYGAFPGIHATHALLMLALRKALIEDLATSRIIGLSRAEENYVEEAFMGAQLELIYQRYGKPTFHEN